MTRNIEYNQEIRTNMQCLTEDATYTGGQRIPFWIYSLSYIACSRWVSSMHTTVVCINDDVLVEVVRAYA